jgi:uncharacterized protein (DUF1919 family)
MKLFLTKVKNKILNIIRNTYIYFQRQKYNGNQVSIISQNCIGGVFYHDMKCEFLSPTINLFIKEPDFIRFVSNLKHYIDCELIVEDGEDYPIGYLDDIRIDFMHYDSCEEAKSAWDRRKKRIDYSKVIVLCTDADGFDSECFELWQEIKYHKILFTVNKEYLIDNSSLYFPKCADDTLPNTIDTREFYKNGRLIKMINRL